MTDLRIKDLTSPVAAAKADWLPGTTWLGFTPSSSEPHAASQCEATICHQMGDGYVLEYVTYSIDRPNRGFENDPEYLNVAKEHPKLAGCLIAVHRLRPTMRPLREIVGDKEFEHLQDMWAQDGKRRRWSVAFPIIESFEIHGRPKAAAVLSPAAYQRLFQHSSGTLRPLNDEERGMIDGLVLVPRKAINAWIAIEDEIRMAEGSVIPEDLLANITQDLSVSAMEGMTDERKAKIRRRAAWLANRFASERRKEGNLICDQCGFDPTARVGGTSIKARSLLDVHHCHPLDEGTRRTWLRDFSLLCPTCHRFEHLVIASGKLSRTKASG